MDLNKDFLGRVIYNEDPTFTGRCKLQVLGLLATFAKENKHWFVV